MYDVMRFWLDRGVDGFRIDVLWLLVKHAEFIDNPPPPELREGETAWTRFDRSGLRGPAGDARDRARDARPRPTSTTIAC